MASPSSESPPDIFNSHTLPFAVFIGLTILTPLVPGGQWLIYPLKTIVAALLLWRFRAQYPELAGWRFHWSALPVGLLVLVVWIGLDSFYPKSTELPGFNPFAGVDPAVGWAMASVRLLGSALVVPVLEELFWRSWLLRYLSDREDFRRVPVGAFSGFAGLVSVVLFGLEHDRWLAGIIAGLAYTGLVRAHKEIRTAIVAHGVTNFALGIYVIATRSWAFW